MAVVRMCVMVVSSARSRGGEARDISQRARIAEAGRQAGNLLTRDSLALAGE